MGYGDYYELKIEGPWEREARLTIKKISSDALLALNGFGESVYWASCKEEMTEFSKRYPSETITLDRFGEEPGDAERMIFRNGEVRSQTLEERGWATWEEMSDED